jgi:glycine/D-amino acid oxidase-like deaminating enzyme
MERHRVVIVGAGVVGCSVAFHLVRLGVRDVLLMEREHLPGTGSTSRANGGIRAQFTTPVNIAMSLKSMEILDALAPEIGDPPLYSRAGYLFVTDQAQTYAALEQAVAFQQAHGVSVDLLGPKQVRAMAPWIDSSAVVGGAFGRRDGFLDPGGIANFLLSAAIRGGAAVRYDAGVMGVDRVNDGVFRLDTIRGPVEAEVVVDAAGAWAAEIASFVGVRLPVVPIRRHILISGPSKALPPVIPMTIDADTGVLVRREGERVLVAYSNPDEPPGFDTTFDPDFVAHVAEALERRFPFVAAAGVDLGRSWAGLYEVTPDHHAVIGEAPGVAGFFLVNGFSGHGVMHAPAAGRCVAELIAWGRCASVDIGPLSLDRFSRGAELREGLVL